MKCQFDCGAEIASSCCSEVDTKITDNAEVHDCRLDMLLSSIDNERTVTVTLEWKITYSGAGIPSSYSSSNPQLKSYVAEMNRPYEFSIPTIIKIERGKVSKEDMQKVFTLLDRAGISCALPEFNGDSDEKYILVGSSWRPYDGVRPKAAYLLTYAYSDD